MTAIKIQFRVAAFLVNCCLGLVSSLYFHMTEGEKKCFIEEIPADTIVVGRLFYYFLISCLGRFNFTSFTSGEHKICLHDSVANYFNIGVTLQVVRMDIRSGERTNNYTEIQKRELLTQLQLRVRRLSAQVHDIHKELIYSRSREKDFLAINHNINMWIYWWPIIRTDLLVPTSLSFEAQKQVMV
uniref:GOLD domain-containing protein n=1 Tax=Poecilia mexicana TaxID=48701 RepID=A0A3B3XIY1_9TELE